MSRPDENGFLSRWSKRKLAEPEEIAEPEAEAPAATQEPEVEKTDDEILEELGLPDPDALKEGDDFSGFMNGAVPTRLRNRALRKLWLTNPVLANIDELVDYGEDFTDAATLIENMQTAYQVGKGWLRDVTEAEDDAEDTAEDGADGDADAPKAEDSPEPAAQTAEIAAVPAEELPAGGKSVASPLPPEGVHAPVERQKTDDERLSNAAPGPDADVVLPPRRMRFRFENG